METLSRSPNVRICEIANSVASRPAGVRVAELRGASMAPSFFPTYSLACLPPPPLSLSLPLFLLLSHSLSVSLPFFSSFLPWLTRSIAFSLVSALIHSLLSFSPVDTFCFFSLAHSFAFFPFSHAYTYTYTHAYIRTRTHIVSCSFVLRSFTLSLSAYLLFHIPAQSFAFVWTASFSRTSSFRSPLSIHASPSRDFVTYSVHPFDEHRPLDVHSRTRTKSMPVL